MKRLRRIFVVIIGIIISAFAFNVFFSTHHIVIGGVSGISIILKKVFNLNESLSILIISLVLYLIGMIFLDKEKMLKSFIVSLLFPLFIYIISILTLKVDFSIDNRLLASISGGVLFGFGIGIIYRDGYTTGGIEIVNKILNKYFNISFEMGSLILDGIIALLGAFIFGFETLIYSSIAIFVYNLLIDKVTLGLTSDKSFSIITTKPDEIKKFIIDDLHHGVTIINGRGAYSNEKKYILFVSVPKRDYYKLKDGIKSIDNQAFFVVSSNYEVGGGK